jgi:hypothetical protein
MLVSEFLELVSALPFPLVVYKASPEEDVVFKVSALSNEYSGPRYCFRVTGTSPSEKLISLEGHLHAMFGDRLDSHVWCELVIIAKDDALVLSKEPSMEGNLYCILPPMVAGLPAMFPYTKAGRRLYPVNTITTIANPANAITVSSVDWNSMMTITLPANKPVLKITSDGKLLWHDREITADDELHSAILEVRDALLSSHLRR